MPTKIACRAAVHLTNFFQMSGVFPGHMLAAGIDSHIIPMDVAFIAIFISQMQRLVE